MVKAYIKFKEYNTFLFAFFLPIKYTISNIFLGIFLIASIFNFFLIKDIKYNGRFLRYSLAPYFAVQLISLFYTPFFDLGMHNVKQSVVFLGVPLLLVMQPRTNLKLILSFIKNGFVVGTVFTIIILIYSTLNNFIHNNENELLNLLNFNYTRANFTKILKIHPSYLGVYVTFSSVLLHSLYKKNKVNKLLYFFTMLVLFLGVIFINQRVIFFIYFVLVLFFIAQKTISLFNKKSYRKLSVLISIIGISMLLLYSSVKKSYIYYRFTTELNWELSGEKNSFYIKNIDAKSDSRIARWKEIVNLIKVKPFFGYGTGSEKSILAKMFKEKGMINSYNNRYDSHNQYLSILIEYGLFGFIIFLIFIFSNIYFSFKYKDVEFSILLFIFLVVSLVENYLTRNAGITFFTFFVSVYLFKENPLIEKNEYDR